MSISTTSIKSSVSTKTSSTLTTTHTTSSWTTTKRTVPEIIKQMEGMAENLIQYIEYVKSIMRNNATEVSKHVSIDAFKAAYQTLLSLLEAFYHSRLQISHFVITAALDPATDPDNVNENIVVIADSIDYFVYGDLNHYIYYAIYLATPIEYQQQFTYSPIHIEHYSTI